LEESQLSSNLAFRDRAYRRGTKSKYALNFLPKKEQKRHLPKEEGKTKGERKQSGGNTHSFSWLVSYLKYNQ